MLLPNPLNLVLIVIALISPTTIANNDSATAEADLLWPVAGETFSLNPKGMAVVFALQNYAEAQKHGWNFAWKMCTARDENFRECAFEATYNRDDPTDGNRPVVLRNGEDDGDVHIEVAHSHWYNGGKGNSHFDYTLSGVYLFEWRFMMGPYCMKNRTQSEYAISNDIAEGSFNVTINATAAPMPTMTPATCGSFLGAVSYMNSITSWDFQQSVANSPGCVGTATVTKSAEPCRATLDEGQIGTVMSVMEWDQAHATGTATATGTETRIGTGTTSEQTRSANAAGSIRAGVATACLVSSLVIAFAR